MIDTHAHLYYLKRNILEIVERAKSAGMKRIVVPGTSFETSQAAGQLAADYPGFVAAALGIHPSEVMTDSFDSDQFTGLYRRFSFCAMGEIGLDYHYQPAQKEAQQALLIAQLDWAKQTGLPVLLHNREADDDMAAIIARYPTLTKVFHCFSSDLNFAKKVTEQNAYFSFSGNITYQKKEAVHDVIRFVELDHILIETDCPWLAPAPYRGQENEPAWVVEVAKKIAQIKAIPPEDVLRITTETAITVLNLA